MNKHKPNGISHTAPLVYKCKDCGKRYGVSEQFEDECPGSATDQKIAALEAKVSEPKVEEVKVPVEEPVEVKEDESDESTVSEETSEDKTDSKE